MAAAALVGVLLSLLMAFLAVYLGLSQHVSGLGITLFSTGLAMFIYRLAVGSPVNPPTVRPFTQTAIPFLSGIPILGTALFNQYTLVYIALLLVPLFIVEGLQQSETWSGIAFLVAAAANMIVLTPGSRMADRRGRRRHSVGRGWFLPAVARAGCGPRCL